MADPDDSPGAGGDTDGDDTESTDASDESCSSTTADSAAAAVTAPTPTDVAEHTTDERTLSPLVQVIWTVRVLVLLGILGAAGTFTAFQTGTDPVFVAGAVLVVGVLGIVWVHLRYRIWTYRVREDALFLERGVLTHVKTVAPHVRIQHVDTSRGPLERALGLSTLVVYTAGSRGADVSVPGLTPAEAADLQQRVKELAIAAEGGDAV